MRIGIVGLPNAGKSTLFNALVKGYQAKVAPYAFTTIDPNIGVVEIPDPRLDRIAEALKLSKKIPAPIEFVDIAGLVKGAHKGEGLGNQFLSHIRGVDAILHIIRGFSLQNEGTSPKEDYAIIREELTKADEDKDIPPEQRLAEKPELVVLNVAEKDLGKPVPEGLPQNTLAVCGKLEAEIIELPAEEQSEYLETLGLTDPLLPRLIRDAYQLLGLITFYTLLPDQIQAWAIPKETKAPQAAGKVHTDFEKHFVAAEVVDSETLIAAGSWQAAKDQGKVKTEGHESIIRDGDVVHFKTAA